ncbi:MAG: Arsenical pump-driving ATPase, partial [uncultured Rubrobacteraceae bacterium]
RRDGADAQEPRGQGRLRRRPHPQPPARPPRQVPPRPPPAPRRHDVLPGPDRRTPPHRGDRPRPRDSEERRGPRRGPGRQPSPPGGRGRRVHAFPARAATGVPGRDRATIRGTQGGARRAERQGHHAPGAVGASRPPARRRRARL